MWDLKPTTHLYTPYLHSFFSTMYYRLFLFFVKGLFKLFTKTLSCYIIVMAFQEKKRDQTFDVLKGLLILFVIAGHSHFSFTVEHFFVSFHMPAFFFISGYFYKARPLEDELRVDFRRLIVPYLFSCFLLVLIALLKDILCGTLWQSSSEHALTALLGGPPIIPLPILNKVVELGPLWFLTALFFVRLIAHFLFQSKIPHWFKATTIFLLSIACMKNSVRFHIFIPWYIPSACCALGFFFVGNLLKSFGNVNAKYKWMLFAFTVLCWGYCLLFSGMSVNACLFGAHYIIDLAGALGGTLVFYLLSRKITKSKPTSNFLGFIGKYSLAIFCFHAIECPFFPWDTFEPFIQSYGQLASLAIFLMRAGILLLITRCVIGIPFFKKIFSYS